MTTIMKLSNINAKDIIILQLVVSIQMFHKHLTVNM